MLWSEQDDPQKQAIAKQIARNLREFGYSGITHEFVLEDLAKPPGVRTVIGMFAANMLADNGFSDMED